MKVVVTGATGAVGRHLVARLVALGHEVVAVSRRPLSARGDGMAWVRADLGQEEACDALAAAVTPGAAVVHLASAATPATADGAGPLLRCAEVDLLGTLRVLDAARRGGAGQVVFTSSAEVYRTDVPPPPAQRPVDEDHPTSGTTTFGVLRLAGEDHVRALEEEAGIPGAILRFGELFGAGANGHSGLGRLVKATARGLRPVLGGEAPPRSVLGLDDAVAAIVATVDRRLRGVLHVADVEPQTPVAIARLLMSLAGLPGEPAVALDPAPSTVPPLEITRARAVLGFEPRCSLREGLAAQLAGARAQNRS